MNETIKAIVEPLIEWGFNFTFDGASQDIGIELPDHTLTLHFVDNGKVHMEEKYPEDSLPRVAQIWTPDVKFTQDWENYLKWYSHNWGSGGISFLHYRNPISWGRLWDRLHLSTSNSNEVILIFDATTNEATVKLDTEKKYYRVFKDEVEE